MGRSIFRARTGFSLSCFASLLACFTAAPILPALDSLAADSAAERDNVEAANRAVVKVSVTYFVFDYESPWNAPAVRAASGTGFIIDGNRIITNAHVVSSSNTVRVQRPSQRRDYEARVAHIAHDCDLAMLTVADPDFFKDSRPLELGPTPPLNSGVEVIGFPIGGDRVSITRGVVSRKGMDLYSHSRIDSHMILQVDAAINPGNSGGPALQDGRVIGVAFQTLTQGQNLGYLIPPPVIQRFLKDIGDGRYDGYIEFGVSDFPTVNPALRRALGLEGHVASPDTGVLIYSIMPGSSADGLLRRGDVLLSVNGKAISETGDVEFEGELAPYVELIDNLSPDDPIVVEVWRDGKRERIQLQARRTTVIDFMRKNYDLPPEFAVFGGLVFQPVDADLMDEYGEKWAREGRADILYRYSYFLPAEVWKETSVDVALTRRLTDGVNLYAERFEGRLITSVNGAAIKGFADFVQKFDRALESEEFVVLRFTGQSTPLVLRSADVKSARNRIARQYGLGRDRFLRPAGRSRQGQGG